MYIKGPMPHTHLRPIKYSAIYPNFTRDMIILTLIKICNAINVAKTLSNLKLSYNHDHSHHKRNIKISEEKCISTNVLIL